MAMLSPTPLLATVVALLINTDGKDLTTGHRQHLSVDFGGFVGDVHSGMTRRSCGRVRHQYPPGTEIRNTRQISALSVEELELIAHAMQLDLPINPAWLGANLLLQGLPRFSKLPPSSRLIASNGTSLVVDMENAPCRFPGDILEQHYPHKGRRFTQAAEGYRGVTLWVERPGSLRLGDTLRLHVPPVVSWQPDEPLGCESLSGVQGGHS